MNAPDNCVAQLDSGLLCTVLVARFYQLAADADQLKHQFASEKAFDCATIVRASRQLGLRARLFSSSPKDLQRLPVPAIFQRLDGSFVILLKVAEDKVLLHDPLLQRQTAASLAEFLDSISGSYVLLTRRSFLGAAGHAFDISWFVPALIKYRRLFADVLIASFFVQLFALVTPLFFQVVIDKVLAHHAISTLNVLAIGLLIISVFDVLLNGMRNYVFAHTTNRVDVTLGARLFNHLLRLPIAYFQVRRVGDTVARVRELETIRNFITGSALTLVIDLFFMVVFFAVMFYYSATLTWIVLGSLPCYLLLSLLVTPILRRRLDEKFRRGAENQAFLVESVTGMETLKAMAVEPQMQRRWEEQLAGYVNVSFETQNLGNISNQCATLISKVVMVLLLWVGARLVIDGDLSVGQLIAFNMISGRVSAPILRLVQLWQDFQQAGVSIERLGDVLNAPPEPGHNPNRTALPKLQGRVTFERVTFHYGPDRPLVLDGVNLDIKPGEVVGIVGRSGSGKSTLTKLAQRLFVPEGGRVLMDGVDLAQVDPAWLRRQVGVVLQESVLFNRSVRDNIALADPAAPMDAVVQAAKMAGAHEFILELPEGYDTSVGEQGTALSGGQKQRIAIARALLTNPRILIFDEATSALDYESERKVQDNMRTICQGRTVFIIAHRLSTVRDAHRIIVMDKGQVVEEGSHDQLLQKGGHYASLHAYQVGKPRRLPEGVL